MLCKCIHNSQIELKFQQIYNDYMIPPPPFHYFQCKHSFSEDVSDVDCYSDLQYSDMHQYVDFICPLLNLSILCPSEKTVRNCVLGGITFVVSGHQS